MAQVIRRHAANREIDQERGRAALDDLADLPLRRYAHDFLFQRVWNLRHNLTAYDAVYIALAEALDAPLVTRDQRLAAAAGHIPSSWCEARVQPTLMRGGLRSVCRMTQ